MEIFIATLDITGKVFIAYAALRVHHRVLAEHSIDDKVFRSMKREQWLGIFGVALIVAAYILEITMII